MTITTTAQPTRLPADAGAPGNLAAHLAALAERRGWTGRPAFHQGHRAYSHGEVHDLAARTATVLADHGVRPGDRVLLALPDSVTWVTTFLALARLGAVAVLVNPELTPPELQFMAEDTEAVLWVTGPALDSYIPAPRTPRAAAGRAGPLVGLRRGRGRARRPGRGEVVFRCRAVDPKHASGLPGKELQFCRGKLGDVVLYTFPV
ncbi:AMP-binding protein, partial [Streptomyces scabiei]|uniref:AMP-binding protein n=1 Tax=Streptomyces scabiei TaxID=1930 RepID=UPI0029ADAB86